MGESTSYKANAHVSDLVVSLVDPFPSLRLQTPKQPEEGRAHVQDGGSWRLAIGDGQLSHSVGQDVMKRGDTTYPDARQMQSQLGLACSLLPSFIASRTGPARIDQLVLSCTVCELAYPQGGLRLQSQALHLRHLDTLVLNPP